MHRNIYPISKFKPIFYGKRTTGVLCLSMDTFKKIGKSGINLVDNLPLSAKMWPLLFLLELENRYN